MASNEKHTMYADDTWVIDICKTLHKVEEYQDSHDGVQVSVSQVPKTLRSSNPEAFIPQFVGLGPYYHDKSLIMDDKLKLDSSKRALKPFLHLDTDMLQQRLKYFLSHSYIQAFYHIDVGEKYPYQTLLYMLTVDCLFLLGLLHRASTTKTQQEHSYFLTGKHGIAMVNSAGVEMTMDSIMRDIFILENQIPTYFLKQVKEAFIITTSNRKNNNGIESSQEEEAAYQDLGSTMKFFCETLCPFVHEYKLSKDPGDHAHLLDLMYHLIVPELKPPSQHDDDLLDLKQALLESQKPKSDPKSKSKPTSQHVDQLAPDLKQTLLESQKPKPDPKSHPMSQHVDQSASDLKQTLLGSQTPKSNSESELVSEHVDHPEDKTQVNTCCSVCGNLLFKLLLCFVVVCMIMYFTILWILKTLFSFIKWALPSFVKLFKRIHPFVETLHAFLSEKENSISFIKPWTTLVGEIKKICENIGNEDYSTHWDNDTKVTIPFVTELHNAGIKFQPSDKVKNGISSIAFDEIKCQFCLPVIKLDVHSEVIIRNLVAYESLIKPNELIFTRYVELMGAIIDTQDDVKLLIDEKIIETELSYEVVTQLFKGMMGRSTRPTKVQYLDQEIKKVNAKFKSIQAQKMAMIKYMSAYGKMLTAFAAIVFLVLTAVQTYCSAFGCARN